MIKIEHYEKLIDGQPEGSDLTGWIEWAESIDGQPCGECASEWENQGGQYDFSLYSEARIKKVIKKIKNGETGRSEPIDVYYLIKTLDEFEKELFEAKPDGCRYCKQNKSLNRNGYCSPDCEKKDSVRYCY